MAINNDSNKNICLQCAAMPGAEDNYHSSSFSPDYFNSFAGNCSNALLFLTIAFTEQIRDIKLGFLLKGDETLHAATM